MIKISEGYDDDFYLLNKFTEIPFNFIIERAFRKEFEIAQLNKPTTTTFSHCINMEVIKDYETLGTFGILFKKDEVPKEFFKKIDKNLSFIDFIDDNIDIKVCCLKTKCEKEAKVEFGYSLETKIGKTEMKFVFDEAIIKHTSFKIKY
jgi:hypothetical protein